MKIGRIKFWLLSILSAFVMVSCGGGGNYTPSENSESGIYLGIIGFNSELYKYDIKLLNEKTQPSFNKFIDKLQAEDLTALYYAVDNAVLLLETTHFPKDINYASIVTFTDGLDNQSIAYKEYYDDAEKYGDDVHKKILNTKVSGIPISAYSIGLKSTGAADVGRFESTLKKLASSSDNWFEVDNMEEVNKKFKEIAEKIYETSQTQDLTVAIPGGIGSGKRIRFTLDVPYVQGNMPSEKAENSKVYIEGVHYRDGDKRYLKNIQCKGLTFSNEQELEGKYNESTKKYEFVFKSIKLDNNAHINKSMVRMWRDEPWVYEEEFKPDEHTNLVETRRTAAIILVLDCTTSLDNLFGDMKVSAKNFINVLVKGEAGSMGGGNGYTESAFGVDFDMVWVEGGTFTMGATSEQGSDYYSEERPTHKVTLSGYYIGKYEITQKQWRAVMGSNPSYFTGDNLPVEKVSWNDAKQFCQKLSEHTGKNYTLPTEAQWEYAARGGKNSKGYKYSGSNTIGNVAWYYDNSGSKTHEVGTKEPNELGLYDMSGNVWEWCSDWYGSYSGKAQTDPQGPSSGSHRVNRGGGWNSGAEYCRVSNRSGNDPSHTYGDLGFRVVCFP